MPGILSKSFRLRSMHEKVSSPEKSHDMLSYLTGSVVRKTHHKRMHTKREVMRT
jgi:hypothetical protein